MSKRSMVRVGKRGTWRGREEAYAPIPTSTLRLPVSPFLRLALPFFLLLAGVLALAACDTADPGTFEEEYVVEGYLVADASLPTIRLSRTAPINATYDFEALAVREAEVRVELLDAGGAVEASYPYRARVLESGVYEPDGAPGAGARVQPLRTYRLDVTVPARGDRITATTVVPDTFSVVAFNAREVVYQSSEQLKISVTRSASPGRNQSYYIFATESLDPREEQLTPFAKAIFDDQDGDLTIEELRVGVSPIFNEANYPQNADGTVTISYPWLAVTFYGPNRISARALDDNLYDYIRSQSVQQGGSTLSPGEIPNPIERLQGARGIFGSYAEASFDVLVKRAE